MYSTKKLTDVQIVLVKVEKLCSPADMKGIKCTHHLESESYMYLLWVYVGPISKALAGELYTN